MITLSDCKCLFIHHLPLKARAAVNDFIVDHLSESDFNGEKMAIFVV